MERLAEILEWVVQGVDRLVLKNVHSGSERREVWKSVSSDLIPVEDCEQVWTGQADIEPVHLSY